jgi:HK97 family phage prohead protease
MTETRSAAITEVRDAADGHAAGFTARVCNYGVRDAHGTSWAPGVFNDSLRSQIDGEGSIPLVWGHDWNDPVGRAVAWREIERRDANDPGGLEVDFELDDFDAVPRAKQAYAQLKSGTMRQFSFAFDRASDEQDPTLRNTVRVTRAGVSEFSVVMRGSVPGTKPLAIRSAETDMIEAARAAEILEGFRSGSITLDQAMAELNGETRAAVPQFEFRAIGDGMEPDAANQVLTDVDTAMASVAQSLSRDDIVSAATFFETASERLISLLNLLGRTPSADWPEGWMRSSAPTATETRTEAPPAVDNPCPDLDVESALAALGTLGQLQRQAGLRSSAHRRRR